jgi:hypothetical protein
MLTELTLTHPCGGTVQLVAGAWTDTDRQGHHPLLDLRRMARISLPPGRGTHAAEGWPASAPAAGGAGLNAEPSAGGAGLRGPHLPTPGGNRCRRWQ